MHARNLTIKLFTTAASLLRWVKILVERSTSASPSQCICYGCIVYGVIACGHGHPMQCWDYVFEKENKHLRYN